MRIVVISDTHMPRSAKSIPAKLVQALRRADYILHAGDWCDADTAELFARYGPIDGVAGNNDGKAIADRFGYRKVIRLGGVRIGIVHGHGTRGTTESRAVEAFCGEAVDVILFGHSHMPLSKRKGDVLLFNPGSPTAKRRQPRYSFGIWDVEDGRLTARHVYFDREERS